MCFTKYYYGNKIKAYGMGSSMHGGDEKCMLLFIRTPERMRPFGKPRHRGEGFRMDLREIGWEGLEWMHLVQDRVQWQVVVYMEMNIQV
jgi:hypothetical protein